MLADPKTFPFTTTVPHEPAPAGKSNVARDPLEVISAAGAAIATALTCDQALEAFRAAEKHRDVVEDADPEDDDAIRAADDEAADAHYAWLDARATSPAQIVAKGLETIEQQYGRGNAADAHVSNPAFLAHVKRKGIEEYTIISIVQDAAALAGAPIDLPELETFDPAAWLLETALQAQARFHYDPDAKMGERLTWTGPGAEEAAGRFAALASWDRSAVGHHLWSQQQAIHRAYDKALWQTANTSPCMVRLYAEMAAREIEPDDVQRRKAIRDELRATVRRLAGRPVGVEDFDAGQYLHDVCRAGARLRVHFDTFGPEFLHRPGKAGEPDIAPLIDQFCQLDAEQIDQLTAAVAAQRTWAKGWIDRLEQDTGCVVSFHDTGIGFGIGPDETGRLEAASAAYNAATEAEIFALRAFGQERAESEREAARAR